MCGIFNFSPLLGYTHPAPTTDLQPGEPIVGKYASIVAFKNNTNDMDILKKISQHIVGMKPVRLGDKSVDKPCANKDDETVLIFQEYVMDNDYTVGEVMEENNVEIVDYQRFECGEKVEP
jgi:elongation factor Ts